MRVRTIALTTVVTWALAAGATAFAAQHEGGAGLVAGDAIELDATVKAVDKETRNVTLEAETGKTVTVGSAFAPTSQPNRSQNPQ